MSALAKQTSIPYDADFYAWTQEQAELLRRLRGMNISLPAGIDLDHIAEEIEDMGRSDLRAARNMTLNVMVHLLKLCSAQVTGQSLEIRNERFPSPARR